MNITSERRDDVLHVAVSGELDAAVANDFRNAVHAQLDGCSAVVVDASALSFIDSSGVSEFVHLKSEIETVRIEQASSAVKRVFEITGLEAHFGIS